MDEENFEKLAVEARCVHKSWKARVSGYEAATKLFNELDEQSVVWNKYLPVIRCIVNDSNAPALEKGLEALLVFVQNYPGAGNTAVQVLPSLVQKCIASPKTSTKSIAAQIVLMYVEIEKQDIVVAELLKGITPQKPKISSACFGLLTEVLRAFGSGVVNVKVILEKIPVGLDDRDLSVRTAAKILTAEIHRWLGSVFQPFIDQLKPVQCSDINKEISLLQGSKPVPSRFLRSEQSSFQHTSSKNNPNDDDPGGIEIPAKTDPLEFVDPVEVLSKIPKDFYKQVKAEKWADRKETLESLEKVLSTAPKIKNGNFNELTHVLNHIVSKDTNIVVVCVSIKCITHLANGLCQSFSSYSLSTLKTLLDKSKEKKQAVVDLLRDALNSVFKSTTLELIADVVLEYLNSKNPNVKSETALFLSRCFDKTPRSVVQDKNFMKPVVSALLSTLADQNPTVRDSTAMALGAALRVAGEKGFLPLLKSVDSQKMLKIKECSEINSDNLSEHISTIGNPVSKNPIASLKNSPMLSHTKQKNSKLVKTKKHIVTGSAIDGSNLKKEKFPAKENGIKLEKLKREEYLQYQVPIDIMNGLSHKDWTKRLKALSDLEKHIIATKVIPPDLGDLSDALAARITDSNAKIAAAALPTVKCLSIAMGPPFKRYIPLYVPPLLKAVGDPKVLVSQPAVDCLSAFADVGGFQEIFASESFPEALKSGSAATRLKLCSWLSEKLSTSPRKTCPVEFNNSCLLALFKSLDDKKVEVRKGVFTAIKAFVVYLGPEFVTAASQDFFRKENSVVLKLVQESSNELELGLDKKTRSAENLPPVNLPKTHKTPGNSFKIRTASSSNIEDDKKPLLDVNNLKHQRVLDEYQLKTIKWDFTNPRPEFIDHLKGLLKSANVDKSLMDCMFHKDFNSLMRAFLLLNEEVTHNVEGVTSNLDLILKWLTIRFFDSSPAILSRGLDFLLALFELLKKIDYCLLDSEASAFVPFLILKLSDSKDTVIMKVKKILDLMCSVYSVSKLMNFLIYGAKNKNPRQRSNCINILHSFLETYGNSVFLTDISCLAEGVATLLKDRDPVVRKASFSVALLLSAKEGDNVLKLIEKHIGKEGQSIGERIRQHIPTAIAQPPICTVLGEEELSPPSTCEDQVALVVSSALKENQAHDSIHKTSACKVLNADVLLHPSASENQVSLFEVALGQEGGQPQDSVPITHPNQDLQSTPSIKLDQKVLAEIDNFPKGKVDTPELINIELSFLYDSNAVSKFVKFQLSRSLQDNEIPFPPNETNSMKRALENIENHNMNESINAIQQINASLNLEHSFSSQAFNNCLVAHLIQKLVVLFDSPNSEVLKCYKCIFSILQKVSHNSKFVESFSEKILYGLIEQLLLLLSNNKFGKGEEDGYKRIVNVIVLELLDKSRKTDLLCVLVQMLGDASENPKFHDLTIKCLWKLNRSQHLWDSELDYPKVLLSFHSFFGRYANSWWKSKTSDIAVRTAKTLLRTMIQIRGKSTLRELDKNALLQKDEPLKLYLRKLLEYESLKKPNDSNLDEISALLKQSLSSQQRSELAEITGKMASDPSRGIHLFNQFEQTNPDLDLHRLLEKTSPALSKRLQQAKNNQSGMEGPASRVDLNCKDDLDSCNVVEEPHQDFNEDVQKMFERLKILQQKIEGVPKL